MPARLCGRGDIVAAVRRAEAGAGCRGDGVWLCPRFKAGEAGLHEARRMLGLALILVEDAALGGGAGALRHDIRLRGARDGFASVAEAARWRRPARAARLICRASPAAARPARSPTAPA